jgi:hypothetical protein
MSNCPKRSTRLTRLVALAIMVSIAQSAWSQPKELAPKGKKATEPAAGADASKDKEEIIVYHLRHASARDLRSLLNEYFSREARISDDERIGAVIVQAPAEIQTKVANLIQILDVETRPGPATATSSDAEARRAALQKAGYQAKDPARGAPQLTPPPSPVIRGTPLATPPAGWPNEAQFRTPGEPPVVYRPTANQHRIDDAMKNLRGAKTDADKQAAKDTLKQLLAGVFDEDMQVRDKQATEIEVRVKKLRQQYQERLKVRDEIIELQIKLLENEAAGLGFNTGAAPAPPVPYYAVAPTTSYTPPAYAAIEQYQKAFPAQMNVGQLLAQGHLVGSPDGKMYAYVENSMSANAPAGTVEIKVCDAATGKLLAAAKTLAPVGPLHFTADGVATRAADGSSTLRVPLKKAPGSNGGARN